MAAVWAVGDRDTHYQAALCAIPKTESVEYYANGALVLDPDDFTLYTLERKASPGKFRLYPVLPTSSSGMDQKVINDFPGYEVYKRFVYLSQLGTPLGASILQYYAKRDLDFFKEIKAVIAYKTLLDARARLIEARCKLYALNPRPVRVGGIWAYCHGGLHSVISVYCTKTVKLMRVDAKRQFEPKGDVIKDVPMTEFLHNYGFSQDGLILP